MFHVAQECLDTSHRLSACSSDLPSDDPEIITKMRDIIEENTKITETVISGILMENVRLGIDNTMTTPDVSGATGHADQVSNILDMRPNTTSYATASGGVPSTAGSFNNGASVSVASSSVQAASSQLPDNLEDMVDDNADDITIASTITPLHPSSRNVHNVPSSVASAPLPTRRAMDIPSTSTTNTSDLWDF